MTKHKHYLSLILVIALGAGLRLWNLDLKPVWMDEVITALFTFGKTYRSVPLDVTFPLATLPQIFTFQPGVSCQQIALNVTTYSTHPPLFFCSMYAALSRLQPWGGSWVEKLRLLPALWGVATILAIYYVNRIAFTRKAGLMAAAVMAVSPFAVYLSQEARHYTLPMLLITLALIILILIQQNISKGGKLRFSVWLAWVIINSIGLYIHYFFVLAFIAQLATIVVLIYYRRQDILPALQRQIWLAIILATTTVILSFLPWLSIILSHSRRAETDWLSSPQHISPLYQTLINTLLMVVALPVENQPLPIAVISILIMVGFGVWLGWYAYKGFQKLWLDNTTHLATLTLLCFTVFVLLQLFAIVYLLGKDITIVPRYNFVYYPSFCGLLAASLHIQKPGTKLVIKKPHVLILLFGFASSACVVSNLVFQKPFLPEKVAQNMNLDSHPLMVVVAYRDYQDVALGLSFGLALETVRSHGKETQILPKYTDKFAFFKQSPNFNSVNQQLAQLSFPQINFLNLWVVGPGMRKRDYPPQLLLSPQSLCTIDRKQHYRIGVPYQLYRCIRR